MMACSLFFLRWMCFSQYNLFSAQYTMVADLIRITHVSQVIDIGQYVNLLQCMEQAQAVLLSQRSFCLQEPG